MLHYLRFVGLGTRPTNTARGVQAGPPGFLGTWVSAGRGRVRCGFAGAVDNLRGNSWDVMNGWRVLSRTAGTKDTSPKQK